VGAFFFPPPPPSSPSTLQAARVLPLLKQLEGLGVSNFLYRQVELRNTLLGLPADFSRFVFATSELTFPSPDELVVDKDEDASAPAPDTDVVLQTTEDVPPSSMEPGGDNSTPATSEEPQTYVVHHTVFRLLPQGAEGSLGVHALSTVAVLCGVVFTIGPESPPFVSHSTFDAMVACVGAQELELRVDRLFLGAKRHGGQPVP